MRPEGGIVRRARRDTTVSAAQQAEGTRPDVVIKEDDRMLGGC